MVDYLIVFIKNRKIDSTNNEKNIYQQGLV